MDIHDTFEEENLYLEEPETGIAPQIWWASRKGDVQRVRNSIACGANVNVIAGEWGTSPLMEAIRCKSMNVIRVLCNSTAIDLNMYSIPPTGYERSCALFCAIERLDCGILTYLISRGISLNPTEIQGDTPVHVAIGLGKQAIPILKNLVDKDLLDNVQQHRNVSVNSQNKQMMTPLMTAAHGYEIEAVKVLIAAGATPFIKDFHGQTALEHANHNHLEYDIFRRSDKESDRYQCIRHLEHCERFYKQRDAKEVAFMMGAHTRLGDHSYLKLLDAELMRIVLTDIRETRS
ncbi:ankyrin repeat-containing domain protein [Baffinella frigidus]|nr:ankyrin repeat-containing domain protein [Cryptophyta sp. CCMP2293]